MGKNELFEVQWARVLTKKEGYPDCKFSVKMGCSRTTVHTAVSNFIKRAIYGDKKKYRPSKKNVGVRLLDDEIDS